MSWKRRGCSRIIPAYAGSTTSSARMDDRAWDHPRIRGEHKAASGTVSKALGSSPHTRGARLRRRVELGLRRIIPAYAGSTGGALGSGW